MGKDQYYDDGDGHSSGNESERSSDRENLVTELDLVAELNTTESRNKRLKEEVKELTAQLNEETAAMNRENADLEELEAEKAELLYQIKHLKKRREEIERQNVVFDKMCANEGSEFEQRVKKIQEEFKNLLNVQRDKVHKYSTLLKAVTGSDKMLDTYGLQESMPQLQEELKQTLTHLNEVLEKTIAKNREQNMLPKPSVKKTAVAKGRKPSAKSTQKK